jgi:hypothetical protein
MYPPGTAITANSLPTATGADAMKCTHFIVAGGGDYGRCRHCSAEFFMTYDGWRPHHSAGTSQRTGDAA